MKDPAENDESIVKPGMKEYHTGHLPKPKLPTVKGAVDNEALPQRAAYSMCTSVAPQPQRAILWVPPVTNYSLHYSRVDHYFTDFSDGVYEDSY